MRNRIIILALVQIFLLVNFSFAQGYMINDSDKIINHEINEFSKKIIRSGLNLLVGFFSIKQIGFVSAGCCEETKEGGFCQNVRSGDECSFGSSYSPSTCDNTNFCKTGWCVGSDGLCSESSQIQCSSGEWSSNKPDVCAEGCCDLGPNTQFRENSWCDIHGGEFDATVSRTSCQYISSDLEGACVYQVGEEKTCDFNTENECLKIPSSDFNEGFLCSYPEFKTNCEKQQTVDCYNGKIYWFDSCGNRENIYSGDSRSKKDTSWNSGIVDVFGSCTAGDEDCGNCDRVKSICREDGNEFSCADLSCVDTSVSENHPKRYRQNGESWCIYEGHVGEYSSEGVSISSDIPGSSHYKKECNSGEISIDNCGIYRTGICSENVTKIEGDDFSIAECRPNMGRSCFEIDNSEDCKSEPDCRLQKVHAADEFSFEACVPRYPTGFNPSYSSKPGWNNAEDICSMATMSCPIIQQYKAKCVARDPLHNCLILEKVYLGYIANENCDEHPEVFYSQMNDFCVSLGDCAGYINTVGNYTGRNDLITRYKGLNKAAKDDPLNNPPRFLGIFSSMPSPNEIALNLMADQRGEIPCTEPTADGVCKETLDESSKGLLKFREINKLAGTIGLMAGGYGYIVAIIAAVVETVVFGWQGGGKVGKIEKSYKSFSCEPWEPPSRSNDCSKCNEGDLPCTEYKCWSLGKNCGILTEGEYSTEEPICVELYPDPTYPLIEFKKVEEGFMGVLSEYGVQIINSTDKTGCLDGNTLIDFSLITDKDKPNKYSRCRWGFDMANVNEYKSIWTGKPNSKNTWTREHNFSVRIPYYENKYVDEDGNLDLFVRCEGNQGVSNIKEYIVNFCVKETPDILPPVIERFEPTNGGYLKHGESVLDGISLYTNEEVASCKYSFDDFAIYENMVEALFCEGSETPQIEYECRFDEIIGLTEQNNKLYFKCNDTRGNLMNTYTEYTISQSLDELKISSTKPSGYIIVSAFDDIYDMELEVATSKGADGKGIARCYYNYSWTKYDSFADGRERVFFKTNSNLHNQKLSLSSGNYKIPVRCEDNFGNEAFSEIEFELDIDNMAPEIATIYHSGGSLVVTTHKDSRCYYNNDGFSCNVDVGNVSMLMDPTTSASVDHFLDWDSSKTYHIQCVDNLKNVGTCVSIIPSVF